MLEELEIDYDVVLYDRTPFGRAPPELKEVHDQGKSPVLVTAEGRVVAESAAIITYLLRTYDKDARFGGGPRTDNPKIDWLRDEELSSFAGITLGVPVILDFVVGILGRKTPWLFKPFVSPFTALINSYGIGPQVRTGLQHCEDVFGEEAYFMGQNPGRADFIMSFPMDQVDMVKMVDLEKDYPKLAAWRKRYTSRPAWKRALEKGNGYDWKNGESE